MKHKIMILVNHDIVIYNFRRELVEKLLDSGYEVIISSPYGERIDALVEMGCKYIPVSISRHGTNIIEDFKLLKYYVSIIRKYKPDVVLTYTIKPNIYGGLACRWLNVPYIANITGLGKAVENRGIMQRFTILLYKIAFKKINCIFFQNEENMKFFIDHKISKRKHRLLPGSGVNLDHFQYMEYPSDETINFIFISRIMKEKGIDHYLEAAKAVKQKYPKSTFHIIGFCEEDYEDKLNTYSDFVKYHGMQKDVRDFLRWTHCTIHPSYYPEGMSNVLLESAASGRPVITTDRSGCREVVDHTINGFLVEPKSTDDLVEKIEKFIHLSFSEKKQMGLMGRKKVEKYFDRKIVVSAYIDEIKNILNQ